MSVIMALRVKGDPQKLESYAAENRDRSKGSSSRRRRTALSLHRFYGSDSAR